MTANADNRIPDAITDYVKTCVDSFDDHSITLESVYRSKVTGSYSWGSGVNFQLGTGAVSEQPTPRRVDDVEG